MGDCEHSGRLGRLGFTSEAAGLWRLHQILESLGVTLPGASAETQPCPPLGLSLMRDGPQTSALQGRKRTSVCAYKPQTWW